MPAALHDAHDAVVRGARVGFALLAPHGATADRRHPTSVRVSINILRELECLLGILIDEVARSLDPVAMVSQRPSSTALRRLDLPLRDLPRLRLALTRVGLQRRRLRRGARTDLPGRVLDPGAVCRLYSFAAAELLEARLDHRRA